MGEEIWPKVKVNCKKQGLQGLPWQPVVKTPGFHCRGRGFDPGRGTKIPHAVQCGQKKKKSRDYIFSTNPCKRNLMINVGHGPMGILPPGY